MAFLITIAGGTGSGKTSVAEKIVHLRKKDTLLISLDHYYRDLGNLAKGEREKTNFDHPDSLDWGLLKKDIGSLIKGKAVRMPIYSFITHTREGYQQIKPKKIIILEGIFALHDPELNRKAKLRIYVDTDGDIRFIRRLQRDTKERGRTPENVIMQWLKNVKPMHDKFIEPSRRHAHIIMPEDPDGKMRGTAIDLIKVKIRSLVKKSGRK
jgi:uridine kinase